MSALLPTKSRQPLIEATRDALTHVKVKNGMFLEEVSTFHFFFVDRVHIPKSGERRERLEAYISETPFSDFVRETLAGRLAKRKWVSEPSPVLLTSIDEFSDPLATATQLVDEFESLPWAYTLTLPLPDDIGKPMLEALGPTAFGDSMRLVALDDTFRQSYPLENEMSADIDANRPSLLSGLLGRITPSWPSQQAALQLDIEGFVGRYGISEPVREALDKIGSFLGIGVALNLFQVSRKYHPAVPKVNAYFHLATSDTNDLRRTLDLDMSQSQTILELQLNPTVAKAEPVQRRGNFLYLSLRLTAIFSNAEKHRQIISAARWLLNSYGAGDALLSFVQATIVLEILLGEEQANDKIGLTELLRNRCAYLVAKSHTEREEIKTKFKEIYKVRSKIVHTGKSKLSMKEYYLLSELRTLGHSVISREIDLLNPT